MRISQAILMIALMLLVVLGTASCSTTPKTTAQQNALAVDADGTLQSMIARDSNLQPLLDGSAGYAIFPSVGKGGLIVGAAFGRGVVYGKDQSDKEMLGFARVTAGSIGGTVGARAYALLLVFQNKQDLDRFTTGSELRFGAEATAIALTEGSSATTPFDNGVAVFAMPKGGLMADASLSGQSFMFDTARADGNVASTDSSAAQASTD
jgi:lipid-binding SYLF domain-containing protein